MAERNWKHPMAAAAIGCFQSQSHLEVQLEAELKLARVEGGGGAAVVSAAAVLLVEVIDDIEEGIGPGFVEAIEEVEALGDDVQANALAQAEGARHPQVERSIAVRDAAIARQIPG